VREEEIQEAYGDLVGLSREEVAASLVERFGLEEAARGRMEEFEIEEPWEALVGVRLQVYEDLLADPDLLLKQRYPHNIELLHALRQEGYRMTLATMSRRYQVTQILDVLDLSDAFELVATRDDVERGKPDPEIDLLISNKLGVPPQEFLVIEDSPAGVRAAIAAEMAVVAVTTGLTRPKFRESDILDSRWIVEDPEVLNDVVGRRIEAARNGGEGTQMNRKATQ
jgi:HAD superfamily hydrolase (TIGR01509 family)